MKKFISILVLIGFISSTTEMHEFLKLPHLIYHFFEHRSENPDMSLAAYFHGHYAHDHENHQDEHHDKGCLPFQGEHNCQLNASFGLYEAPANLTLASDICSSTDYVISSDSPSSDYLSKIWQPPKLQL